MGTPTVLLSYRGAPEEPFSATGSLSPKRQCDVLGSVSGVLDTRPLRDHETMHVSYATATDAFVMGSSTYEWLLRDSTLTDAPDGWTSAFGDHSVIVFTTRALPVLDGADVRFLSGFVTDDEITLHISPAFLSEGKELLPGELGSDRLTLVGARRTGQFIEATWQVIPPA